MCLATTVALYGCSEDLPTVTTDAGADSDVSDSQSDALPSLADTSLGDGSSVDTSADASGDAELDAPPANAGEFPPPGTNTQIESVSFWTQKFDTAAYNAYCDPLSNTNDSWKYYGHSYCTDAFTAMYRVTGDTQYIDEALRHVKTIISNAKPSVSLPGQFNDEYMGWVSQSHPQASANGKEQQLYEIYQWRYVSTMLRVMSEDAALMAQPNYKNDFDEIFAFSERNVFDKWYSRGPNSYVYRSTPHIAAHMALLATNFSKMTNDPERKSRYEEVVRNINFDMPNYDTSLKTHYQTHPSITGAYTWTWGFEVRVPSGDDVQDVSHANAEMAYYVEAEGQGRDWTKQELQPFIVTLRNAIFKDPQGGSCSYYVDGSGSGACWIYDGFVKLGRYDQALQQTFETMTGEHSDPFVAHAALNARFLGAAE